MSTGTGRVTMADIALASGVSIGTVSKALNNRGQLRENTREKILAAARELGFSQGGNTSSASDVITIGLVGGFIFGVYLQNVSAGAYVSTLTLVTGLPEVLISVIKATTFGLIAGLVGSFVGGLLASLISGDGISIRPSGLIGSVLGAVIVLAVWRGVRARR